jgi:DNA-binding MarR family transcriptional regulator
MMPSPAPAPLLLDADSAGRLRVVIGRLSRRLRATPSGLEAGLSPTRISLLLSLVRLDRIRLSELGELEGLNPTMLSRSVTQLVDAGLVGRTSDASDRRAAWVAPTTAGKALARRIREERTDALNAALAGLAPAQRDVLEGSIDALEALAEQLRENRS